MDDVPGVKSPRKPEVFLPGTKSRRTFSTASQQAAGKQPASVVNRKCLSNSRHYIPVLKGMESTGNWV
jgi:hypothetical protein